MLTLSPIPCLPSPSLCPHHSLSARLSVTCPCSVHSLLVDDLQAMPLILIQGGQDSHTIVQIIHHILYLVVLLGKRYTRCLVLQKVNKTEDIRRLLHDDTPMTRGTWHGTARSICVLSQPQIEFAYVLQIPLRILNAPAGCHVHFDASSAAAAGVE